MIFVALSLEEDLVRDLEVFSHWILCFKQLPLNRYTENFFQWSTLKLLT